MAKDTVVLLVHGMGTSPKGAFQKEFIKALTAGATNFGLGTADLTSKVDYQEFNYSESFDSIRKQFAENAEARKKGFSHLVGKGFDEKLITQLTSFESKFGKDEFFYTHWLDVILYGTMYFGESLRVKFIEAFEKLIKKYKSRNIHIVCHSLGTAVVHDSLAKYYRAESTPFDKIPDKPLGLFNVASLWTLANVSRMLNILNGLQDPHTSTVQTGDHGCTNQFFNAHNRFDPFTWFKTYSRQMDHMEDWEIKTIRKVNTHDFSEYVSEPRVARGLLQVIYGVEVSEVQLNTGKAAYESGDLGTQVKDIRDLVENALGDPSVKTLKDAIEVFKKIQAKIKELSPPPQVSQPRMGAGR